MKTKRIHGDSKMKNTIKRIGVILGTLAIIFAMAFPIGINADTEDDLNQAEENAANARTEKAQMMEELETKQANLDAINAEIADLQTQIEAKQAEIEEMVLKIEEMQHNIDEQKGGLGNRLRNMYKSGSVGVFDILLDSGNFSDFLTNMSLVQRIYDSDQKTLEELERKCRELEQALADLEVAKQELDAQMVEMETKQAAAEEAKAEVEAAIAEIQARIEEYEAEAERLAAIVAEEQAELQRQMEAAAAAAAAGDASYSSEVYENFSGSSDSGFIWPVSGPLTSYFGYRSAESTNGVGTTNHGGIDIGVGTGTIVRASRSGYVSSATGWSGGYGYAVFLNHDSGYSTVYGHNSSIIVSAGQYVNQGDPIAYSGSTGWSTGPHVHFEVRVNGTKVDPLAYLP